MTTTLRLAADKTSTQKIDKNSNRLNGVVVMNGNRDAVGHGVFADTKTLQTLIDVARDGTIVHFGHPAFGDTIPAVVGRASSFRIDKNRVLADIQLLDTADLYPSFVRSPIQYILTQAEKHPDTLNLSVSVTANYVWDDGGTETEHPIDGKKPNLRITELHSVDFVTTGALTDALFNAQFKPEMKMTGTDNNNQDDAIDALKAQLAQIMDRLSDQSKTHETAETTDLSIRVDSIEAKLDTLKSDAERLADENQRLVELCTQLVDAFKFSASMHPQKLQSQKPQRQYAQTSSNANVPAKGYF